VGAPPLACVAAMLLLAAAAAGCGAKRSVTSVGAGSSEIEPAVHFCGANVVGSLYANAGPSGPLRRALYPGDVYLIRGAPAHARRLTASAPNTGGVFYVTANGSNVMVTGRHGFVRRLLVRRTTAAWGPGIAVGQLPTLGLAGRFACVEPFGVGSQTAGYWIVYAGRLGHGRVRVAMRTATTRTGDPVPVPAWQSGAKLAILLGHRVILDVGTSSAHSVSGLRRFPFSSGSYIYGGGPHGMLALTGRNEIALLRPGAPIRVIKTSSRASRPTGARCSSPTLLASLARTGSA
jgi:hypothetical protein